MRHLIRTRGFGIALLAALSVAVPAAQAAANCVRTITIQNLSDRHYVSVTGARARNRSVMHMTDIASLSRVPILGDPCIGTAGESWQGNCGYIAGAAPGQSASFRATYRVLGCNVERVTLIEYACLPLNPAHAHSTRTIYAHGGAFARPQNTTVQLRC